MLFSLYAKQRLPSKGNCLTCCAWKGLILRFKITIEFANKDSLLHASLRIRKFTTAKLLIERGYVSLMVRNNKGLTPLMIIVHLKEPELIRLAKGKVPANDFLLI